MKAITAVCATGASVPAIVNGRVNNRQQRNNHHATSNSTNGENAEIKMYLSKLKDLVPFMPKNRKLSKLEIIQHVIDYICDLQSELETSPAVSNFDAAAVLHELQQHDEQRVHSTTNLNTNSSTSATASSLTSQQQNSQQIHQHQLHNNRQPLVDRSSPNLILSSPTSEHHHHHQLQHHHHHQLQNNTNSGHFYHQSSSYTTTDKSDGNSNRS